MAEAKLCDVNSAAPSSLRDMVGQESVVAQVAVALAAAFADGRRFDHALLVGPPGLGKSQTSRIIAAEMGTDLHEILGQSIASPADLNGLLLAARDRDVIHLDECHELEKPYQTALLMALDQRRLVVQTGAKNGLSSIPLADFSLLLSTTDEFGLVQPLRDRMKLVLRFGYFSEPQLSTLLAQRVQALGWSVHAEVFPLIARRSRGTPRLGLRLLQSCRRVCRAEGASTITTEHLRRACKLETIDILGLGPTEQHYVALLADGANRLNVLASMLGLPTRTVAAVIEPFLLRTCLVVKDDSGRRELTAKGREHLSRSRETSGAEQNHL